jgi:hypothetical protein
MDEPNTSIKNTFIKTDLGNYFNTKYITKVKYNSSEECFYINSLIDYSGVGIVCKKNNPENYRTLKEHIGFNENI